MYRPDSGENTRAERVHVEMTAQRQRDLDNLLDGRFKLLSPDLSLTVGLATAIAAYLHRLNGSERITIGIPIHHRSSADAKRVIGPVVELFPLSIDVLRSDTFATLHERITKDLFAVLGHAQPGTSPRQSFDVVLNVHAATFGPFGPMATHHRWVHPGHVDPHHRLRVQALDYDGSGHLELALDINQRVADADHRLRAPQHLAAVLDAMTSDPERMLRTVGLITPDERMLLSPFTTPSNGTPLDAPVPELIERQLNMIDDRVVMRQGTRTTPLAR